MPSIAHSGELGTIREIHTAMCFPLPKFSDIRYNYDLGGGAMMDAGCYAVHMARLVGGPDPEVVSATAKLRDPDIDRAMEAGIAYVSEDRKRAGLVPSATVGENLSLAVLRRLQKWGFIQARRERAAIGWAMETLRIDPPDPGQLVGRLSGGNQQKVVLGRCLLTEPKVLLLDEPTRGVDVGAKREIYSLISNFTKSNGGVVMVSSEIEEMMEVCDRILILRRGRLVEALSGAALTTNRLMMVAG